MNSLYVLAFIPLGIALSVSAAWVVRSSSYIASRFQIQSFLFGFLLLGFVTTIPEMFVAYQAVHDGIPQLSVGNLLGGSIFLLSFIMGIGAIVLGKIILDHGMNMQDIALSSIVVAAPAIALWDGKMTRFEGIILVAMYLAHVLFVGTEQHVVGKIEQHAKHIRHMGHALFMLILGLVGLAVSSRFIVTIAEYLAHAFSVAPFIVGLFIVTLGTNLPELILVCKAILSRKRDIAFGDVLGSAVINTPILGIVCIVAPFSVPDYLRMRVTLLLLATVAIFFFWAASTKKDVTRREGILLFIVYVVFAIFEAMNI